MNMLISQHIKDGRKMPKGQSTKQIENKLTMPWPKKKEKQTNRQIIVHKTQHKKT